MNDGPDEIWNNELIVMKLGIAAGTVLVYNFSININERRRGIGLVGGIMS